MSENDKILQTVIELSKSTGALEAHAKNTDNRIKELSRQTDSRIEKLAEKTDSQIEKVASSVEVIATVTNEHKSFFDNIKTYRKGIIFLVLAIPVVVSIILAISENGLNGLVAWILQNKQ